MMTFHVVGMPQSLTTKAYSMCGFSQKTIRFCWMMKALGHKVYLYAGTENEAVCDEHIVCFTEEDRNNITEHSKHCAFPSWDSNHRTWIHTNNVVIQKIKERKKDNNDFICVVQGTCQRQIADAFPELKTVEYGIGYEGFFSKWKVFESHAWRAYCVGRWLNKEYADFHKFDSVIHNFYDVSEFKPEFDKKSYLFFVGRINGAKGVIESIAAAKKAGIPLKIAGAGDLSLIGDDAEYVGQPTLQERNKLMAEAKAVICPSKMFEPFNNVACEAQLSGTPVICTNWGGFTETVEHEKSGFRCSSVQDMVNAISRLDEIDNRYVLYRAVKMFSMKNKMHDYDKYFKGLLEV